MARAKIEQTPTFHTPDSCFKEQEVNIALVGCGGNGSQMLTKLARLDYALRECGHPYGLRVYVYDPDRVSTTNVGRQCYSPADVGHHKSIVLVNRINAYYGFGYSASPRKYDSGIPGPFERSSTAPHILISCVDTAKARKELHKQFQDFPALVPRYWLDLGNTKLDGQVILGQPRECIHNQLPKVSDRLAKHVLKCGRLKTVTEIYPEILMRRKESEAPTCSVAEALDRQSLFINDHITDWAVQILDDLLRVGELSYCGAFINLKTGKVNTLPVPVPELKSAKKRS